MTLQAIYSTVMILLIGIGITTIVYVLFRKWTTGRILVFIYTKERQLKRYAVRPDSQNKLQVGGRAYLFKQDHVFTTRAFFLRETFPALIFDEGRPSPVDMYTRSPGGGVSSAELSEILGDQTVRDFVSATRNGPSAQALKNAIMMGTMISIGGSVGGVYILFTVFPGLTASFGGG